MVLPWGNVAYGAVLSAILAAVLIALAVRPQRPEVIIAGAFAAAGGPVAWNTILNTVGAREFFVDAPILVFPISWQDTGSGVFALALAALVLGFGPLATKPGRGVALAALLAGASALLVDIYLY
ncbi:MAG TPA: hypothetical protein VFO16_25160 [Pseudonocardiaceae bacterium]|nr:hypothetical protein [Pseudonocardiaceae bacterium]